MRSRITAAVCAFAAAVALAAGAKTVDAKGVVVNGKIVCKTERRDFADGWAVRYVLPEGERRVEREETVWTLPADARVWYQEYGMDYEKPYRSSLVSEIPVGTVMDFPVTAKLADGTYRLITEANVVGYTDSAAKYLGDGRFGVFYVNDPDGFDQKGADTTPWRVMLVAKDLQTLATSDIVRRLCPAPSAAVAAKAAKFVRPGRAVWQWLPAGAPKYGEQKEWYDRTKALGFEYYLIDDGWRDWRDGDMDQWACLKKWIDYGKSIGVETFMWVDSKEMRNAETRRRYLAKVKEAGAVGIKIDFHPAPSCEQMAWYEEALADTLEFGLMTDYHGCVKPSGREKTWPHEVAREAIRGHEWHITRYKRVLPPEHDCILPFNRLVQGHADYTPVVFEEKELAGYTRARELAQGIIFSAPFLCLGDYPENYIESPAAEVVKALEPVYDETIILPGSEIGECVAVAKRKDEKWFIAIENGAEDRSLEIPLSFLQSGKWKMKKFADAEGSNTEFDISGCTVSPSDTLKLALRAKGGFVAVLTASAALHSRFGDGMLSVTQPRGWLGKVCHAQADGLTGHPEALSYPYDSCLWAGRIVNGRTDVDGWWRYEQTAYYTDGLLRLGYALGDSKLIAKGEKGVDYTLDNASPDGMLGDPCLWDATKHKLDSGFEMWPMAVFFRAMKAKYDATRDERIPAALAKYYLLNGADMLAKGRNTINVEGIAWTYGRTGDKRLVEMAEKAWNAKKSADNWSNDLVPAKCSDGAPIYMHGVSYSEELKIPLLLYACTGKREYLEQAVNAEWKLVRDHMLPDGCPSSTEQTRGNSVHWGHETCVVSDYTWSLGYFLEVLGDAHYADKIERCVFNAGLGSVMNDFKSLQYFSNLNQFIATSDSNHNPFFYGTTWSQYRPTHETECCAGNMHRFLPNYISRMWLKDAEGSPVAALYGPCEVDFGWARITEETHYPFDGKIVFRFGMEGEKDAAFTYRVPGWCVKGASVKVNGESVPVGDVGSFAAIRRTFRDGDTIELDFPMDTVFEVLPRRHYVIKDFVGKWTGKIEGRSVSQGTVVRRGPLVFAYQVPAERTEDAVEHARMRGKKSANPDFKCWNLRPAGPFNYALAAHEAETVADGDSVCVKVPVRRIKWELENDRFTPDLPENPVPVSDVIEYISLVPYGNTALRLAVFPDLQDRRSINPTQQSVATESPVSVGEVELKTYPFFDPVRASVGAPETRAQGLCRCQVHRGGGRDTRPDNSLETFLWCWGHGVAPEADVRLTKDGVAIAFHDPTLQRIARGIPGELQTREIKDMAWDEIKDVDVGSYMGEEYATTRIATMDSIFAAMAGRPDRILYLDEKGAPPEMMAEMAKKHGVEKQIYYTSPDFRLMARWQKVVPGGLGMVWLGTWAKDNSPASVAKADEFLERTFREMEDANWKGISQIQLHIRTDLTKQDPFCPSTECLKKSIELLHSKGITVQAFTWTEGANKDVLRRIWSLGFDNFATDDPLVLFELLPEFAGCGK